MKQSPLFSGVVYILLGSLFTYFAIQNVNETGWGFFSYLLVALATFDFGSGIRMIMFHFKLKNIQKK
ncbi:MULTISPECIES: YdiK family protein [Mesobacillus]|uniref:YdiK family protein n=1 Tax=Mesobacillus TaxID=2675231 RepID=UPI0017869714|nr:MULTISPECIES: YdiK family protein [Mesobacillus]MCM3576014.1 YdiK family protein [Mesobacillus subterraneus]UYZ22282.1 YdiK family protein [Mesobacillus jeotgali]